GLRVGLRFFPDSGCDQTCDINACATPTVPPGELTNLSAPTDAHEQALYDAFIGVTPSGGTPLSAAVEGAVAWGRGYLAQNPFHRAVVVLVTDGQPEDYCVLDHNYIIGKAREGYASYGVVTFAVGLEGSNESLMNQIAQQGGSGQGIFIGTANAEQELSDALDAIRGSAVACAYQLPDQASLDPSLVNVTYLTGAGDFITLGQVPGEDACTSSAGGWYYDNPADPRRILFCPATCAAVQGDFEAQIELVFGCQTIPA